MKIIRDLRLEMAVPVTDQQVRKLMQERCKGSSIELSALRSGMSYKTASKYINNSKLPSEVKKNRTWRTRKNPFADNWAEVESMLKTSPDLEAKTIFEHLTDKYPERYQEGQLRTLQRQLRRWRAENGPEKNVIFPQEHKPGEAFQTDFTWCNELNITICGLKYSHMLCHVTLPYSNWQWASVCQSESLMSLKRGLQAAIFQLGHVPEYNQTDNSTSATHKLGNGKRAFNTKYVDFLAHFGMHPRTISVGASCQNGDVESLNRSLKRRLMQYLMLRGSFEFSSVEEYQSWINKILLKINKLRSDRLSVELNYLKPLTASALPEYVQEKHIVTTSSTVRVRRNTYSVPSRLIGQMLTVNIFDDKLEICLGNSKQLEVPRLRGQDQSHINYRHVIWSLLKKPGAFKRYRYREEMFPSLVLRKTYDRLLCIMSERDADIEYLRILHLAAATNQFDVETAINLLLEESHKLSYESIRGLVECKENEQPVVTPLDVDLTQYDFFIKEATDDESS